MTLCIYLNLHFEVITRCTLYSSQSAILAANAKAVLASLLDQVGQYLTEGLERAIHSLIEATALRARFRNSGWLLLVNVASDLSWFWYNVAVVVWEQFSNILQILYLCSRAERDTCKGLQQCIETAMNEVECILYVQQMATVIDHQRRSRDNKFQCLLACTRV